MEDALHKLQAHAHKNRIRVRDFFLDFDKLRSGTVSKDQFHRALQQTGFGVVLTTSDIELLQAKYVKPNDRTKVNYAAFCDDVDSVFTVKDLERNPMSSTANSPTLVKRRCNSLTPDQWSMFQDHHAQWVSDTQSRGLILKQYFRDFDVHRNGRVTAAQFQRCFPFRTTPALMEVLLRRYRDDASGDVNYLAWVTDVDESIAAAQEPPRTTSRHGTPAAPALPNVDEVLRMLQRQILTNRIRVDEVFKDHDKLRSGFITVDQFAGALGSLKFQKWSLQPRQIEVLCSAFQTKDGLGHTKVAYKRFLEEMDSVFTEKELEKNPTRTVQPRTDLLASTTSKTLPGNKEPMVQDLLQRVRTIVKTRRILLKPLFHDFDRAGKGVYQTKYCTRARFERALGYAGIILKATEYELLCDKFQFGEDRENISYNEFCREVDETFDEAPVEPNRALALTKTEPFVKPGKTGLVSIDEVEDDIQTHCLTNRIRVHEFFRDFDQLRSGVVTQNQFASAMTITGLHLDAEELQLLYQKYASDKPGKVKWLVFADAIDEVFTSKKLEKAPGAAGGNADRIMAKRAAETQPAMTPQVEAALRHVRDMVRTRGILLPPFFQDFDKHRTGRISLSQFKQVLSRHHLTLSDAECDALSNCYKEVRTRDVNYRRFVRDVDETEDPYRAAPAAKTVTVAGSGAGPAPLDPAAFMHQLRNRVATDRIRVRDFLTDADRLRKGYITAAKFRSGLDMSGLKLTDPQFAALERQYANPSIPDTVLYTQFCRDLDAVGDVTDPSASVKAFVATERHPLQADIDGLDAATSEALNCILEAVQGKIRTRRVNPKPYFQDFDKIHRCRVTATQFASVLNQMQLSLPERDVAILVKGFQDDRGDIDYGRFCRIVDPM